MADLAMPVAGQEYPATWSEFRGWFPDEDACGRYLERLRWPGGFVCPRCGVSEAPYRSSRGRLMCSACGHQASVTAGTIFARTRTPLSVWFAAAWYVTSQKHGVSALGMQRILGLGSYQTAWTLMHRFRRAMVRPQRDRLHGTVEVDEFYVDLGNRDEPFVPKSLSGKRETSKLLVVAAVEVKDPSGLGRIRLRRIPAAAQRYVQPFVTSVVEPSARVRTDGSLIYNFLPREGYEHDRLIAQDTAASRLATLPGVNRVASLLKRWLLGTHHGAIQPRQLDYCLDEFVFRFNRRTAKARGLLFYRLLAQAVHCAPVTYRDIAGRPPDPPLDPTLDLSGYP